MYLTGEQPAYADQLINHLQSLPNQLLEGLEPAGPTLEIADRQDIDVPQRAIRQILYDREAITYLSP